MGNRETVFTMVNGEKYVVSSPRDSIVSVKEGDAEVLIDTRGKIGLIKAVLSAWALNPPNVTTK